MEKKLSSSKAQPGQAIKSAVAQFASISCATSYPVTQQGNCSRDFIVKFHPVLQVMRSLPFGNSCSFLRRWTSTSQGKKDNLSLIARDSRYSREGCRRPGNTSAKLCRSLDKRITQMDWIVELWRAFRQRIHNGLSFSEDNTKGARILLCYHLGTLRVGFTITSCMLASYFFCELKVAFPSTCSI